MQMIIIIKKTAVLMLLLTSIVYAQGKDYPWQKILEKEGLKISFIFYSSSIKGNNGVVLKLHNKSDKLLKYNFEIVFKNDTLEHTEIVSGKINPYETITGSEKKLFWVPFKNGSSIGEVGVRNCKVLILK